MNHVITSPNGRDLGFGCSCGNRFPTKKLADKHAEDQNLIEENAAKAEAAKIEEAAKRVAPADPSELAAQSNSGDAGENDTAPVEAPQAAVAAPPAPEPPAGPSEPPTEPAAPVKAEPTPAPQRPAGAGLGQPAAGPRTCP